MQTVIEPESVNKESRAEIKKIVVQCVGSLRSTVFWPSQHILIIYENESQRRVELGYSASRILELLIERADDTVSRDEIFAFAWPDRVVGQNSLNQAISSIREWLADEEHRVIIQTVPRRGYQFNSRFLQASGHEAVQSAVIAATSTPAVSRVDRFSRLACWCQHNSYAVLAVFLLIGLCWRVDWGLWLQPGLFKTSETHGLLTAWYTGANSADVEQLQSSIAPVRERLAGLLKSPGTVLFNTMHSFYEIVCIGDSAVEFLYVHKSQLSQLTDEQLGRCLK